MEEHHELTGEVIQLCNSFIVDVSDPMKHPIPFKIKEILHCIQQIISTTVPTVQQSSEEYNGPTTCQTNIRFDLT